MKNIAMLAAAGIRKNKSQALSLLVFVLIAAMFLSMGLVMLVEIPQLMDKRAEELHASHYMAILSGDAELYRHLDYFSNYRDVREVEVQEAIGGLGDYVVDGSDNMGYLYFAKPDANMKMDAPSLVGESRPLTGDGIYIPYFIMLEGNFSVGDTFEASLEGEHLSFTIAGASEEIMLGARMNTVYRFYVSEEMHAELCERFPAAGHSLLLARFGSTDDAPVFHSEYIKDVPQNGLVLSMSHDEVKQARLMISLIAAIVLTAFALILLIVNLIVIRFRIVNSIEENMTNIGVLKSMGYRSRQIVASYVLQFGGIALVGAVPGLVASYAFLPLISRMLLPLIALDWAPAFSAGMAAIPLLVVLFAVCLIAYISARRIGKLHPLAALRGAISQKNITRTVLPLDNSRGPLSFLLALKYLLRNKKQAIAITVIIAAVTMASVAGIAVDYNMNEGRDGFARALMGELPDANYTLKTGVDGEAFRRRMIERPDVRKAIAYDSFYQILVEDYSVAVVVTEDCSLLEGKTLLEGRHPENEREVALGTAISKVSGKRPGDTVTIKVGEREEDYVVTGVVQYMNFNGFNGIMTGDGVNRVDPGFTFESYNVYIAEGVNIGAALDSLEASENGNIGASFRSAEQLDAVLGSMSGIFAAVAAGIVAVTGFVVILTLYVTIKTVLLRKRRELGVQKALGFTTMQLMNQNALSFTPIILAGVALGAVAGYFLLNPMMGALLGSVGVVKTELPVPLGRTFAISGLLMAFAYIVSMALSLRIRKVSAYALVTE